MTKDEALTLALKQLDFFDRSSHQHGCVWQKHLITAIKEALAEPWKGLTKEETDSALSKYQSWYEFAAHLENILKEKNQ